MAQIFYKRQVVTNRKVDFVEEVGVDIADAIDWLDDIKSKKGQKVNKKGGNGETFKIEKDHFESEKEKTKTLKSDNELKRGKWCNFKCVCFRWLHDYLKG